MAIDETPLTPQEARRKETIRLIELEIDQFESELCETTRVICDHKHDLSNSNITDEARGQLQALLLDWTKKRELVTAQKKSAHESLTQLKVKDLEREKELIEERRAIERAQKQAQTDSRRFEDLVKLKPSKLTFRDPRDSEQFITEFLEFVEIHLTTIAERKIIRISKFYLIIISDKGHVDTSST
jgi:hypothetical protein